MINAQKPAARLEIFFVRWRTIWLIIGALTAAPAIYYANQELLQTRLDLDTRLIVEQRLWESDPGYAGSAQNWTRFAAWLLTSEQLLERVRALNPARAESIEEEYRRDAVLAYGGVIVRYLALWGAPLGIAYVIGFMLERRCFKQSL